MQLNIHSLFSSTSSEWCRQVLRGSVRQALRVKRWSEIRRFWRQRNWDFTFPVHQVMIGAAPEDELFDLPRGRQHARRAPGQPRKILVMVLLMRRATLLMTLNIKRTILLLDNFFLPYWPISKLTDITTCIPQKIEEKKVICFISDQFLYQMTSLPAVSGCFDNKPVSELEKIVRSIFFICFSRFRITIETAILEIDGKERRLTLYSTCKRSLNKER